jgi:phospholipid/cholesterol/gamma-HCH transport system substrate-binding protein
MERNANYALVGLISALLVIALLVFVVWLAGSGFSKTYDVYDVIFDGPVRGLSQGGEVHFNGIKVGDVSKVFLDPADPQKVIARIRVTSDVPIRQDSYATLEPQGITGVNFIQITAGTASKPLLKDTAPPGQIPRLSSKKDAFSDLLAGGSTIVEKSIETLNRVNQVLSDKNIKSVSGTLDNVEAVTAELRERKSIIADAQRTLQTANQAAEQFREVGKSTNALINGQGKQAVTKLSSTATELEATIKEVRGMLAKLQDPTVDFARTGLPQVTASLVSLQKATDHLDELLSEIQSNPRGLVGKAPAKQMEVKP